MVTGKTFALSRFHMGYLYNMRRAVNQGCTGHFCTTPCRCSLSYSITYALYNTHFPCADSCSSTQIGNLVWPHPSLCAQALLLDWLFVFKGCRGDQVVGRCVGWLIRGQEGDAPQLLRLSDTKHLLFSFAICLCVRVCTHLASTVGIWH